MRLLAWVHLWLKQRYCEHFWRPMRVETRKHTGYIEYTQPGKICDYCGKTVMLDIGMFYAQFGRMPW